MLQKTIYLTTHRSITSCVQQLENVTAPSDDWLATKPFVGTVTSQTFRLQLRSGFIYHWLKPVIMGTFQSTTPTSIRLVATISRHEKLLVAAVPGLFILIAIILWSWFPLLGAALFLLLTGIMYLVFCDTRDAMVETIVQLFDLEESSYTPNDDTGTIEEMSSGRSMK